MIIDSLPTGSLFSFLWNMLVSISFQFVGFLLTYLLHTTHAARFGSRAGLGVTLIQYGFALRSKTDVIPRQETEPWGWKTPEENRTGDPIHRAMGMGIFDNSTMVPTPTNDMSEEDAEALVADATTEWLSFFLMTVGEFNVVYTPCSKLILSRRVVHPSYFVTRILACQTLGTWYHQLATY